ncbi:thioesterase family protein [Frankia nepalensis]|uniref:thioesterase family protein n=1 Tax=Frankia nepalensis TaxID=1836974 RepID=UPI0027DE7D19|nr:thioesterase family protein [Frankia nepalensis]
MPAETARPTDPASIPEQGTQARERKAYFRRLDDGRYAPNDIAGGVWAAKTVSGRILGGLVTHVLEQEQSAPGYRLARLTVDMFRAIPMAPLTVTTALVRAGGRIRVADAHLSHDGTLIGRATAVFLRPSTNAPGEIWRPDRGEWTAPEPGDPRLAAGTVNPRIEGLPMLAGERPDGPLGPTRGVQRGGMWVRELHPVVEGMPMTPLTRVGLVADMTSATTHRGTGGIQYINTDWSLNLVREPVGEFLGVLARDQHAVDGVSFGQATIHDAAGLLGTCTVTALANPGRADPTRFPR